MIPSNSFCRAGPNPTVGSPAGSWCSGGSQFLCDIGTFNPTQKATSSIACLICPEHMTTEEAGAHNITQCICDEAKERFAVATEYGGGCGCLPGRRFSSATSSCQECETSTTSLPNSLYCEPCAPSYYLRDLSKAPLDDRAWEPCLPNAVCNITLPGDVSSGGNITTLNLAPGWWRLSVWTTDVRKCTGDARYSACLGGTLPANASCANHQRGPLCRVCRSGHYLQQGLCHPCPDLSSRIATRGIPILLGVTIVGASVFVLLQFRERLPRALLPLSTALRGVVHSIAALGLQPKLKVVVSFYQVVSVLDSTYSTEMPTLFQNFMDVFSVVEFKWEDILARDGCVASGERAAKR